MKIRTLVSAAFLALGLMWSASAGARTGNNSAGSNKDSATPAAGAATHSAQDENVRMEGEKRFRSNCGRCHAAPPRFAPRVMATIVRHMRVRANITDDDMHYILRYMTE